MSHNTSLILLAVVAVLALVVLIARFKLHPFPALMLMAIVVGVGSGMNLQAIVKALHEGVGNTLGFLGVVVGLGIMLGRMLGVSGGAHVIAQTFVRLLGDGKLPWAMLAIALITGIPVLFGVGLVLLAPLVYVVARETRTPVLALAIPLVAGLSVSQGFLPPHPGPMLAIEQVGANVGKTILYGFVVGIPTAILAGPVFSRFIAPRLKVEPVTVVEQRATEPAVQAPGSGVALLTILLPILLMLGATFVDLTLPAKNSVRQWVDFVGSPIVAMLLAVLVSLWTFGIRRGIPAGRILKVLEESLGPAAGILLVIGAGGGFGKMLERGGVGAAIADVVEHAHVSPLLLGWIVAASIRVAVGSATVAITMASAIMAPVAATAPGLHRELLVLAMGAGSLFCSHVNDAGFWLVKESFNLTVTQTLKSWTVLETGIGVVGLGLVLLLGRIL
jgi:GntP family gluconate:H+ symporter